MQSNLEKAGDHAKSAAHDTANTAQKKADETKRSVQ